MSHVVLVCLFLLLVLMSSRMDGGANHHRNAERAQVLAQYCMPTDDDLDPHRLFCAEAT